MTSHIEKRVAALGLAIPSGTAPVANFVPTQRTGNLLFVSGHVSAARGRDMRGKLGRELAVPDGYAAARQVTLDMLGTIRDAIGNLDRIKRIVKLFGMVNSEDGFSDQAAVINGASDLLVEIFGETGKHSRSAVGMAALPFNSCVELEMIVEVEDV